MKIIDFTGDGVLVSSRSHGDIISSNVLSGNRCSLTLDDVSNVSVQGNLIGTDSIGNKAFPVSDPLGEYRGISLVDGASNNTIGGTSSSNRNVIAAGANDTEILISDHGTSSNVVEGNFIGINAAGNLALGTNQDGIDISSGASSNTIGLPSHGNVISGNGREGIYIDSSNANTIQGNFIGTNPAGTAAMGNGDCGIFLIDGASNNLIGSKSQGAVTTGSANVISGNGSAGVEIIDGFDPFDNGYSQGNVVAGNRIGTDVTGTHAVANLIDGIALAQLLLANTIGLPSDGNVISGNASDGIAVQNDVFAVTIQGNYIGTDITGNAKLPNGGNGISLTYGPTNILIGNTTGGVNAGSSNLISGNKVNGVYLIDATNNTFAGNRIGTNAAGNKALGNAGNGVFIAAGATGNLIGLPNNGNVISGNVQGNRIQATSKNTVEGNFIGLDITGTFAIPNQFGLLLDQAATDNVIGIFAAGAVNYIAGNAIDGIYLTDPGTKGNSVLFNVFGSNTSGHSVPNKLHDTLYANGATP